jgi:hypothetical protein
VKNADIFEEICNNVKKTHYIYFEITSRMEFEGNQRRMNELPTAKSVAILSYNLVSITPKALIFL